MNYKKQYDDPIAHFKEIIQKMNEEEKLEKQPINLKLNKNEHLTENTDFSLEEVYNTLTYIEPFKYSIQKYIYDPYSRTIQTE